MYIEEALDKQKGQIGLCNLRWTLNQAAEELLNFKVYWFTDALHTE